MAQDAFDFDAELAALVGDINGDGVVDARDAAMARQPDMARMVDGRVEGRMWPEFRKYDKKFREKYGGQGHPPRGLNLFGAGVGVANWLEGYDAAGKVVDRANMLPLGTYEDGSTRFAYPGSVVGVINALTAPARALSGDIAPNALVSEGINAAGVMTPGGMAGRGVAGRGARVTPEQMPPAPPPTPPPSPTGTYRFEGSGTPLAYKRYRPLDIKSPDGAPPAQDLPGPYRPAEFYGELYAGDMRPETNALIDGVRFNERSQRFHDTRGRGAGPIVPNSQGIGTDYARRLKDHETERFVNEVMNDPAKLAVIRRGNPPQRPAAQPQTPLKAEDAASIFNAASVSVPEFRRALDSGDVNGAARIISQATGAPGASVLQELSAWLAANGGKY